MSTHEWLGPDAVHALRLAVAVATAILLAAGAVLARRGHGARFARSRDAMLAVLGILGALGWFRFGSVPPGVAVHVHDLYHYYVAARYFPELGYDGLYACTLAADMEAVGTAGLEGRRVRNLATNVLETAPALLPDAERCRLRFGAERWADFTSDVAWFRRRAGLEAWPALQTDHGFNGSPVWLLAGSVLAGGEGGIERSYAWLPGVDAALVALLFAALVSGFGWRSAAVAAVFLGTNGFSGIAWTGGSLLRQDWLVAFALGLSALRRERPALAGAFVALSSLLRVFPAIALGTVLLGGGLAWMRRRDAPSLPSVRRFALGAAAAAVVLGGAATVRLGPEAWAGFADNSRKHVGTPLLNQMGLGVVLSFAPESAAARIRNPDAIDPWFDWKIARRLQLAERRPIFVALCLAYAALLARALRRRSEPWIALALGAGAVPIATQLTCYYHVVLFALALLHERRAAAGVALCAFAATTQWLVHAIPYSDVPFVWASLAEVSTVFLVTFWVGSRDAAPATSVARPQAGAPTPAPADDRGARGSPALRARTSAGFEGSPAMPRPR